MKVSTLLLAVFAVNASVFADESKSSSAASLFSSELIFPLHDQHNHAPGIVELPNGELLASWYRGSGERKADDVMVMGARKKLGQSQWGAPFVMVDTPGFPDCNTTMWFDHRNRLCLCWPLILANTWESCLTKIARSNDYSGEASPRWEQEKFVLLKPEDFSEKANQKLEQLMKVSAGQLTPEKMKAIEALRQKLSDRLYQRLGWQPRCKPTVLKSGRILLPLYTDTFSISIMAVSDDHGETWYASEPLIGFGNIQPTVFERKDGSVVAYMRENGLTDRIRICESQDGGLRWGEVTSSELLNPGAGVDGVRLSNGNWLLVYNDLKEGRNSLAVSLSTDEGQSWKWTKHLEKESKGSFHYPAVIQGKGGLIHVVYSYFVEGGKSMKHVAFDESWIRQ